MMHSLVFALIPTALLLATPDLARPFGLPARSPLPASRVNLIVEASGRSDSGIASAASAPAPAQEKQRTVRQEEQMTVKKMTPNLYADDVAACVRFWVDRLHFVKTMEVPEGNGLAFAALEKGPIELMYGSYSSLDQGGMPANEWKRGSSFLFVEVEDLDEVVKAMEGAPALPLISRHA